MNTYKATHSMLLPSLQDGAGPKGEAPRFIHILPSGTWQGRDGRGPYTLADADTVIAASMGAAASRGIPVDYDHQLEHTSKNGMPAPASGWITGLQSRDDGIWAEVEWTQKAAAAIAALEYRHVSPVYYHDKSGKILLIESVALTNSPNFTGLKALAHTESLAAVSPAPQPQKENPMHKALAAMLGLHEEAAEGSIEASVRALQEENKALAAKAESPDPAKFVPLAMFETVQKELASVKAREAATEADKLVESAATEGKVLPIMRDWAQGYASSNPEGFKAWAAIAPDLRPGNTEAEKGMAAKAPGTGQGALSDAEKAIAAACGLSEDEYKKEAGV